MPIIFHFSIYWGISLLENVSPPLGCIHFLNGTAGLFDCSRININYKLRNKSGIYNDGEDQCQKQRKGAVGHEEEGEGILERIDSKERHLHWNKQDPEHPKCQVPMRVRTQGKALLRISASDHGVPDHEAGGRWIHWNVDPEQEGVWSGITKLCWPESGNNESNVAGRMRDARQEGREATGETECVETKCIMCSEYVLWYIGLEKVLYCLALEHHKSWIVSLDLF